MKCLKLAICFLFLASAGFLFAGEETVKGEVVDLSCYLKAGAHGEKHKQCAQSCLERGLPMGILTESGAVYLLLENHQSKEAYATAKANAAEIVEVKGEIAEKGGMKAIVVNACSKI